jgi:glutathione reductase (NADPH)
MKHHPLLFRFSRGGRRSAEHDIFCRPISSTSSFYSIALGMCGRHHCDTIDFPPFVQAQRPSKSILTLPNIRRRSNWTSRTIITSTNAIHENEPNHHRYDYDYFVIGAGSGGIASARRAASYHQNKNNSNNSSPHTLRVAIAEQSHDQMGGTSIHSGCIPKKVMYHTSHIADMIHDMDHIGFMGMEYITFDFQHMKRLRDQYIQRLNRIYIQNLKTSNVTQYYGTISFIKPSSDNNHIHHPNGGDSSAATTRVPTITSLLYTPSDGSPSKIITAKHVLIATGGKPMIQASIPGVLEHTITSDGFFQQLEELPRKAVIVGGGYIAVELAGILQALGTETTLVVRHHQALRNFDTMLSDTLDTEMIRQGIKIYRNTNGIKSVEQNDDDDQTKNVYLNNGEVIDHVNVVIVATGRVPNVEQLQLSNLGIAQSQDTGHVITNEYCETNVPGIYAIGDVVYGSKELSPTAIAAGRRLADRLFGGFSEAKVSYDLVPSVVFSHPPIGTIGLTEDEAVQKYGSRNIKIYKSKFTNLFYGPWQVDVENKPKTAMKLICVGTNELIVGLHVIGMGADEMLQGFAVAIKMGATKRDFDATMAIHPTAAEEFVTMHPWGPPPPTPQSS